MGWRYEARALTETVHRLTFIIIKIWHRPNHYFTHVCPLCGCQASIDEEVKQHMLSSHLQFQFKDVQAANQ
jgi:hypothetical protein